MAPQDHTTAMDSTTGNSSKHRILRPPGTQSTVSVPAPHALAVQREERQPGKQQLHRKAPNGVQQVASSVHAWRCCASGLILYSHQACQGKRASPAHIWQWNGMLPQVLREDHQGCDHG